MQVELVFIDDESLRGFSQSPNDLFLNQQLSEEGYTIIKHTLLTHTKKGIFATIDGSMADILMIIGAKSLIAENRLQERFSKAPIYLQNSQDPPFGFVYFEGKKGLFFFPGNSSEIKPFFRKQILPFLRTHFCVKNPIFQATCTLLLLTEKEVSSFVKSLLKPGVEIHVHPSHASLKIRFTSFSPVTDYVEQTKRRFGEYFIQEETALEAVHQEMQNSGKKLALAESCTGGAIAARLTSLPGASSFLLGSLVTYSNTWKERFLGVRRDTLTRYGPVSLETVQEMGEGLLSETDADYGLAVTGLAGPSGAREGNPLGTVYIAVVKRGAKMDIGRIQGPSDRANLIAFTVETALGALVRRLRGDYFTFL